MADFFVVDHDSDGRIYISYNENSDLSLVVPAANEYIGKPINAVIRLRTGPSLFAAKGDLKPVGAKSQLTGVGVPAGSSLTVAGQHGLPPGNWTTDPSGDAAFPVVPVRGQDQPALDILEAAVGDDGRNLTATIRVKDLSATAQAQAVTALGASSWMVTWWQGKGGIGPSSISAPYHSHWFLKYLGGSQFVYGRVSSVDAPALGAPTPKILTYAPTGTASGAINGNTITMSVPISALGGLAAGDKLDQVTAYTLAEHTYETLPSVVDQAKSFSYRVGTPAAAQHAPDGYVEVSLDSSFSNPVKATLSGTDQWTATLSAACGTVYVRQVLSKELYTPLWDDVQLGQTAQLDFPCATPSPSPSLAATPSPTAFAGNLATGGGWLAAPGGGKVNFGFRAEQTASGYTGDFELNDKTAGVKVDGTSVTAMNAVSGSCGGLTDSPTSIEIRGNGTYNGAAASFRLCVADLGQPGKSVSSTPDRLYLECTSGCTYRTTDHVTADTLGGGNISVSRPAAADASSQSIALIGMYELVDPLLQPQTIILRPVLLTNAAPGTALPLTVNVYDGYQHAVSNASISLSIASGGTTKTVTALTGATGVATIPLTALTLQTEYIASAGVATSNAIAVAPTP